MKIRTLRIVLIMSLYCIPASVISAPVINAIDSKTISLFSVGAATGLLISLFHRDWVLDKVAQINQMHGSGDLCDSTLWSPFSFNGIDDTVMGKPFAKSSEETRVEEQFQYNLISDRVHFPTLMSTRHTVTNDYLVKKDKRGKKFAIKTHTSFHTVEVGSIYPYIFGTALITLGTGYAFTLLNKK
ncbi:MAG TPA: hypothetical protein VHO47_04580 [Candidatus Babeliales bacterium]|nr:hypothetical protein [Candidatus Babeliales bacterium]